MQGFTQWPTYPQLLVNGELLGGCDIIMEMQQDGSLKSAIQEALGTKLDTQTSVQQRIQQLLGSKPVMLFMKVSSCLRRLQLCHEAKLFSAERRHNTAGSGHYTTTRHAMSTKCMPTKPVPSIDRWSGQQGWNASAGLYSVVWSSLSVALIAQSARVLHPYHPAAVNHTL